MLPWVPGGRGKYLTVVGEDVGGVVEAICTGATRERDSSNTKGKSSLTFPRSYEQTITNTFNFHTIHVILVNGHDIALDPFILL